MWEKWLLFYKRGSISYILWGVVDQLCSTEVKSSKFYILTRDKFSNCIHYAKHWILSEFIFNINLCMQITLHDYDVTKNLNRNNMELQGTNRSLSIFHDKNENTLIARLIGSTWGPSGADRTQVGPMLASWSLLSGLSWRQKWRPPRFWHSVLQVQITI